MKEPALLTLHDLVEAEKELLKTMEAYNEGWRNGMLSMRAQLEGIYERKNTTYKFSQDPNEKPKENAQEERPTCWDSRGNCIYLDLFSKGYRCGANEDKDGQDEYTRIEDAIEHSCPKGIWEWMEKKGEEDEN